MKQKNNFISKKTSRSILQVLFAPQDIKKFEYLRAVILCGLPGSGKSTIAQLLDTCYGFERFSTDQVRTQELFKGQEHRVGRAHERVMAARFLVYEELARRLVRVLVTGKRVVVDGTNMDEKRLIILGGILAQVPVEQVAMVVLKPPEWIMRRRFLEQGESREAKNWWGVYKYWRRYVKEGKATFPTGASFPRVQQIQVRRYSIRTFDWVLQIKAILWDVDGTLYKNIPKFKKLIDQKLFISAFAEKLGIGKKEGEKKFFEIYKKLGSKTQVLNSVGLDGKALISKFENEVDFGAYLKKDKRLLKTIRSLVHVRHFILSNAGREGTRRKLIALGLPENLFEGILVTHDAPYLKPDPRVFTWAARKTGFSAGQLLAVGDREATEIIPAKQVGMRTAYVWGVSKEADVSLPTVYEVAELFGKEI